MMHNVVAPSVGESITEVSILKWAKSDGEAVSNGELLLEIESDKATVEVVAPATGALKIIQREGQTVPVGAVVAQIDDAASGKKSAAPAAKAAAPAQAPATAKSGNGQAASGPLSGPAARKMADEAGVDLSRVAGSGKDGRVTKGDVQEHLAKGTSAPAARAPMQAPAAAPAPAQSPRLQDGPGDRRVPMKAIRRRIAERLVEAQSTAAILTTFNEVNMKPVMDLRKQHKDKFQAKHGVPLSFMSFFTRASVKALEAIPDVNAFIDGTDVIYHDYCNIGIAVGTERGLVVPVLRNAQKMSFVEIEKGMAELAGKARSGKLSINDMNGGTFTISNGGTYGSLMSTPILNPPQSGILGMHKIMDRPMAVDGKVVILPMMYLALSYDHRLIDGKEAVTFLVKLKELLENPEQLGLDFLNG